MNHKEKDDVSVGENDRNRNIQASKKCRQKQNGESEPKMSDEKVFYAGYPISTERQKGMSPNMNRGLAGLRCNCISSFFLTNKFVLAAVLGTFFYTLELSSRPQL
jgi:hypothetical protein